MPDPGRRATERLRTAGRAEPGPALSPVECAEKYEALATLFRTPGEGTADAIRTLLAPCGGVARHDCAMFDADLLEVGNRALQWVDTAGETAALEDEMTHLLNGSGGPPRLSPCGADHLEGPTEQVRADVATLFGDLSFPNNGSTLDPSCPCHIANELDFVAHCLRLGDTGLDAAAAVGCAFVADHLFAWGIVFAAALAAIADNPVLRFAGRALEGLLFCEASTAFARASSGRGLPT